MTISCVLWGGYAGGNVGDALTLAIGLKDMLAKYPKYQIAILSLNPPFSAMQFPDAKIIQYEKIPSRHFLNALYKQAKRHNISSKILLEPLLNLIKYWYLSSEFDWVKALRDSDELYLVGGGYLTDLFQLDSILLPILIAQHYGKRIVTAPVGIGPFNNPINQRVFQKSFNHVQLTVRDPQSQSLCQNLGLQVNLARDDGFRLGELPGLQDLMSNPQKNGKIGICVYHQHGANASNDEYSAWWRTFLEEMRVQGLADRLEGYSFHTALGLDYNYLVNLFTEVGIPLNQVKNPTPQYLQALVELSQYNLVITTRFHAAVAASAFKIPFFAVSSGAYYRNKMDSVVQGQQEGASIDLQISDPKVIAREVSQAYHSQQRLE